MSMGAGSPEKNVARVQPGVHKRNGLSGASGPTICRGAASPGNRPLSWHPGASRADQDRKLSDSKVLREMCEDLARIVAMVQIRPDVRLTSEHRHHLDLSSAIGAECEHNPPLASTTR